ncbi:MAG: hypothetical protein ACTSQZ_10330 [Candidatus Thorarchaeota archaeon]
MSQLIRFAMSVDEPNNENGSEDMAEAIIDSVDDSIEEDGLTKGERRIEIDKESMRIRKAKELKKQLRRRELGLLNYKWPAVVLVVAGILSIWTEFLVVMIHPPEIPGVDTFWITFIETGNVFFVFPLISGIIMIVLGYFAYTKPIVGLLSLFSIMMREKE